VKQHPEPGVEYAAFPTEEYRIHGDLEAARSLARWLGVDEDRARDLLEGDPAECRSAIRRRQLERRSQPPG
jgi:hypothetical protein